MKRIVLASTLAAICALMNSGALASHAVLAPVAGYETTDTGTDEYPTVATDGVGTWVAAWRSNSLSAAYGNDSDILMVRSTDNGGTWTSAVALNSNAANDGALDDLPKLATDDTGTWVAVWYANGSLGGGDGDDSDIVFARSVDSGVSWSPLGPLNSNAMSDSASDLYPDIATDGSGTWIAAWSTFGNPAAGAGLDVDLFFTRSTDGGLSWAAMRPLNTNATIDTGGDYSPVLETDGNGRWVAVWSSNEGLNGSGIEPDIFVAHSTDNGENWSPPSVLNSRATVDGGAWDIGPAVATDGTTWVTAWESQDNLGGSIGNDYDILVATSTDGGMNWAPQAALNSNAATDTGNDASVDIEVDSFGNFVAAWETTGVSGYDLDLLVASSAGGADWSPVSTYNTNAAGDVGFDREVDLATDSLGRWVTVWSSNYVYGNDRDVLYSQCSPFDVGCTGSGTDPDGDGVCTPEAPNQGEPGCTGIDACPQLAGPIENRGCPPTPSPPTPPPPATPPAVGGTVELVSRSDVSSDQRAGPWLSAALSVAPVAIALLIVVCVVCIFGPRRRV